MPEEKSTSPDLLEHHLAYLNYYNDEMLRTDNPTTYADLLRAGNDRLKEIEATFYPMCLI